jgi:hypothetical protein
MLRICKLDAVVFSGASKYNEIAKQAVGFHESIYEKLSSSGKAKAGHRRI